MPRPVTCAEFCSDRRKVVAARRRLPPRAALKGQAVLLSLLADPGRLSILFALSGDELCVCDLSRVLGASVSAVSHQLRLLRGAGLVSWRGQGKLVFYRYAGAADLAGALRGLSALAGRPR